MKGYNGHLVERNDWDSQSDRGDQPYESEAGVP